MGTRIIKCTNCGTFNKNIDHCTSCGALISHKKKIEIKVEEVKQQQIDEAIYEIEHPNLAERLKKHPNFFLKIIGYVLYSAYMVVSIIGGALAWFIAMIAAG